MNNSQIPSEPTEPQPRTSRRLSKFLNPWLVVAFLILVILVLVALWRPWQEEFGPDSRTVEVTGTATVKAEPDEFVFNPLYQFKSDDKEAALQQMSAKSETIVKKLKELGLSDHQIKTNSSGYEDGIYLPAKSVDSTTYTLNLTITAGNRETAQKVQDYLVSTKPVGTVSPYATFSKAKQKELESKARDEAISDARSKAEQSARNLGFAIAAVKSVVDGQGFGGPVPLYGRDITATTDSAAPSLEVQPGENELSYAVTVVYFIR